MIKLEEVVEECRSRIIQERGSKAILKPKLKAKKVLRALSRCEIQLISEED